jgi:hypothetical protein
VNGRAVTGVVAVHSRRWARPSLPLIALSLYGAAFAWVALQGGALAGGDHPGQLYRMSQALTLGVWPWRLNPGWWAGYAELQYYPPGMAYVGAAVHAASLGRLDPFATYQALLWITLLLPGFTVYALLVRVVRDPWLALPGAFLALTLSAGSRSGLEEGVRWGLVAARLGLGFVPLLALSLHGWIEQPAPPLAAPVLLAAIILIHPAHAPAAVALIALAVWYGPGPRSRRLRDGFLLSVAGAALAGFWLLPLLAHLQMALPLAWGDRSLSALTHLIAGSPLLLALLVLTALAWLARRAMPEARWLCGWAPLVAAIILADVLVADRTGILWLPADRLLDSFLLALVVGASLALSILARGMPRLPRAAHALALIALCIGLSRFGTGEAGLSLWPAEVSEQWPKYAALSRKLQLDELWQALRSAPPGRILFLRSCVPLELWPDWWRPRSTVTALTPLVTGRAILNGTYTHPSPIAGTLYTGSPANQPITKLVEERDGVTLFGRPLDQMGADAFDELADRFRISAVVALAEDEHHLSFIERNPRFNSALPIGLFRVFISRESRPMPEPVGPQKWRLSVSPPADGWRSLGVAYSPLWRASAGGRSLPIRPDELGLLAVQLAPTDPAQVDLEHVPGPAEWSGLALSGVAALALLTTEARRRRTRMTRTDSSDA